MVAFILAVGIGRRIYARIFHLGGRIRWYKPGALYVSTSATVDRSFLFAPNHREDNSLLRQDCSANALSLDNDLTPEPSIINIVGSSIGRALEANPINVHAYECNINHPHRVFSPIGDDVASIPKFFQHAASLIARGINKTWDREGSVFQRARVEECTDDEIAEQQLLYAITNPVKDGLIRSVKQTPFFSTYRHQAHGDPLKFWWIDKAAFWRAGGPDNEGHRLKDYLKWTTWETTPLPHLADMTVYQHQTYIRKSVRKQEQTFEAKRKEENRTVMGVSALYEIDPRDHPKTRKKTRQPSCHSSTIEAKLAFEEEWREFLKQYLEASGNYRDGNFNREFPQGSFRPPLVRIINEDGT